MAGTVAVLGTAGAGVLLAMSPDQRPGPAQRPGTDRRGQTGTDPGAGSTPRPRPGQPASGSPRPEESFSGWMAVHSPTPTPGTGGVPADTLSPGVGGETARPSGRHPVVRGARSLPAVSTAERAPRARTRPRTPEPMPLPRPRPQPEPRPEPRPEPQPTRTWGGHDPCAKFDDFRRPYCDELLRSLAPH
ncbi:hypothetical protein [Spongiactinospora sp. TRM90649]|uniref:hypothetical protein n=1 Tax=Spongiactinospora sp. TRM90649 TaxID=3031114 RepID=UPI0023F74748|nr:hypothetical protein [Spongiactinospora sp. TRM90649]MDF5754063.1 hypothetical protein [Spongiactinospora sp. TRM90649]